LCSVYTSRASKILRFIPDHKQISTASYCRSHIRCQLPLLNTETADTSFQLPAIKIAFGFIFFHTPANKIFM